MLASNLLGPGNQHVPQIKMKGSPVLVTREELASNSAHLEDFFHRDRVRLDPDYFAPISINPEGLMHIVEWAKSRESPMLGIMGPYFDGDEFENPMALLAARFIQFAADVPIISHFCELRRNEHLRKGNTMEMQGLIELVYSLIRQLIEVVPLEFECNMDFSAARFDRLDGAASTWSDAVTLFSDLERTLPGKVFCVIDGLQWLDDRSMASYLSDLVELLRGKKLQVLFTTAGQSRCLIDSLEHHELVVLDNPKRYGDNSFWDFSAF
jgi:hypothetical protein